MQRILHEYTPNVSNNIESNASVATHLFMFEHDAMPNETDLLRDSYTRSYKFEFYKCDDASDGHVRDTEVLRNTDTHSNDNSVHESDDAYIGSQEFQPEVSIRDVRIVISDPLNYIFFHVLIMITSMLFFLLGLCKTDFRIYFIITFHVLKTV